MRKRLSALILLLLPTLSVAEVGPEPCRPFYQALQQVPHESIFQQDRVYLSRRFETGTPGCFLVMVTSEARLGRSVLPDLSGDPGTVFYATGWRSNPKYKADGPGTSVSALEKEDALCLVYIDSPAYVDDSGSIVQDEYVTVRVECLASTTGE